MKETGSNVPEANGPKRSEIYVIDGVTGFTPEMLRRRTKMESEWGPIGSVQCDTCGASWPCHLFAWGRPESTSKCNICGGEVFWNGTTDIQGT